MAKLLDIYSTIIANWLNGGAFTQKGRVGAQDIVTRYGAIFTRSRVKKVFQVVGIKPENLDLDYVSYIREQMFLLNPDVEVIISLTNHPVHVGVNNEKFTRQMARASERYSTYAQAYNSQSPLNRLTGKTYRMPGGATLRLSKDKMLDLRQAFASYVELYNHLSGQGTACLTDLFIEIVGDNLKDVKRAGRDLFGILQQSDMGVQEIKNVSKTYLDQFGLAEPVANKVNKKFLPELLFTDKNTAAFSGYKGRGLVSDSGLLLGVDLRSRLPFMVDIFKAPSAQVFLLLGKTGSGKTFSAFQMALSAMALPNCSVSAIDIKGNEWARISPFVQSKILSFDEGSQAFVNTLRLDDVSRVGADPMDLYNTAVRGTMNLLSLIVNLQPEEGNKSDLEMILREAVLKLYSMRGVNPSNPASFENTRGLHYSDLLPLLESLSTTATYTPAQKKMVALARARCHAYIGESGIFAEAFRNEITLSDVLESPLVIYEFNKNANAMSDSLDVLRVFMVQFLDTKKQAILRSRGEYLFCFYEELQRCDQFGDLLTFISHNVTGSRSNNAVVILLLNSLRVLNTPSAQDIRSNITSMIVGSCETNDIETIRTDFNQPWVAHQLTLFQEHTNVYRNCFAASVDTGAEVVQTVYKVILPESLRARFQTRSTSDSTAVVQTT